jgi:hypothetical protein
LNVTSGVNRLDSSTEVQTFSTCMVRNMGTDVVYIGGGNVTTGNGFPLNPGETFTADLGRNEALYGVVSTTSQPVRVIEVGAS